MIFLIFTLVISDPYSEIDYAEINSHEIEREYLEDVIHVHESDSSTDYDSENIENEEKNSEDSKKSQDNQNQLNMLFPYIFPRP